MNTALATMGPISHPNRDFGVLLLYWYPILNQKKINVTTIKIGQSTTAA
jgi:hypothetical protein